MVSSFVYNSSLSRHEVEGLFTQTDIYSTSSKFCLKLFFWVA